MDSPQSRLDPQLDKINNCSLSNNRIFRDDNRFCRNDSFTSRLEMQGNYKEMKRRLITRLGSRGRGRGNKNGRSLGHKRKYATHKCVRAKSSEMALTKNKCNVHVHLKMDNVTAVAHINRMCGTRSSQLLHVSRQI